jgi:negative regulator of flagellin synthesis FlgM
VKVNDSINNAGLPDLTQPRPGSAAATPGKADTSAAASAAAASNSAANVQLSPQYQSLGVKSSSPSDSFDAKKVAEIKAAIANGTFQVDPDKVATGVLNTAQDLVSTRQY